MTPSADTSGSAMARVRFEPVEGATELFTPAFAEYLVRLHERFTPRIRALMAERAVVLKRALEQHVLPSSPPRSTANSGDWQVPPVPADLLRPGIEISGPCSITSMFINALNPGPEASGPKAISMTTRIRAGTASSTPCARRTTGSPP
jgi:malate synthase